MNTYKVHDNDILHVEVPQLREYILKIRDLPEDDRPREKLIKNGPGALSVSELLAIVLGTGTRTEDVMSMATRSIREYGEKSLINELNPVAIEKELSIPLIKACQIVACGEIGRRFYQRPQGSLHLIRSAKDVFEYLVDMRNLPKEHLRGIYLNTHHHVIHDETISIGTLNSNLIHPREVFRPAIEYGAAAVILAHNHPSNVAKPSNVDLEITKQLIEAGKIVGISVLDHVIITKDTFISVDANYL